MNSLPTPTLVLFVASVQRVTEFYRELFRMELLHADETHSILEIHGLQVVIHALHSESDVASESNGALEIREDSHLKICLPVESIAAARTLASSLGGHIKSSAHEWEARGFRACDGHDPEGNVFQARQHAAEPLNAADGTAVFSAGGNPIDVTLAGFTPLHHPCYTMV